MADNIFTPSIGPGDTPLTSYDGSDEDSDEDPCVALCAEGDMILLDDAPTHFDAALQFSKAISIYKEAVDLDPRVALPHIQLSTIHYELGNYTKCITECHHALDLLQKDEEDNEATIQVVRARLINALLHTHQVTAAVEMIDKMGLQEEELEGDVFIHQIRSVWNCADHPVELEKRIIESMPYYKPSLQAFGYDPSAQDNAQGLYDHELRAELAKNAEVSFFFAGVQDCRDVYHTWIQAHTHELEHPSERKYNFVFNDLRRETIARNLVMWHLVDQVDYKSPSFQQSKALNTLVFLFSSPFVPAYVFRELCSAIEQVIKAIKQDSLPAWISVRGCDKAGLIEVLELWLAVDSSQANTKKAMAGVIEAQKMIWEGNELQLIKRMPTECFKEVEAFRKCGAIYPAKSVSEACEPRLADLLVRYTNTDVGGTNQNLRDYLRQHWKVNLFSIDADGGFIGHTFCPFILPSHLYNHSRLKRPDNPGSLYDYIGQFFLYVAGAVGHLRDRMSVKTACGDATQVLDIIRQCWAAPGSTGDNLASERIYFPAKYDRVQLFALPDHYGGTLFYALWATPVLKTHNAAWAMGTCSRNPSTWESIQHFNNEHIRINDCEILRKISQMVLSSGLAINTSIAQGSRLPIAFRRSTSKPFPFHDLLPQKSLFHWLYSLFIKVALPIKCGAKDKPDTFSLMRLNLTVIFRLLIHLRLLGYPSHWLSRFLTRILKNDVFTSARAAECYPADIAATEDQSRVQRFNTAPFTLELSSLTPIFQRLLPFSIVDAGLPALCSIYSYSLCFDRVTFGTKQPKKEPLTLELTNVKLFGAVIRTTTGKKMDMRDLMLTKAYYEGEMNKACIDFRDKGVHQITTFSWDRATKTARFWLRKDVVDEVFLSPEAGMWNANLMRTDTWEAISSGVPLRDNLKIGEAWNRGQGVDGGDDNGDGDAENEEGKESEDEEVDDREGNQGTGGRETELPLWEDEEDEIVLPRR